MRAISRCEDNRSTLRSPARSSSFAYLILERVRTIGLAGSSLAQATLGGVRLRLLKVAALVKVSVRRLHEALCSAFPLQGIFRQAAYRLERCASPSPG
jgi:hypothetical protein